MDAREATVTIGRFHGAAPLAAGGTSSVFLAYDADLQRKVVLKCPRLGDPLDAEDNLRSLRREYECLSRLDSRCIVRALSLEGRGRTPYLALEYIQGRTLEDRLARGRLSWEEIRRFSLPLLCALSRVHDAGWIHRDLTPGNVILGDDGRVVLIDFGLARDMRRGRSEWDGDRVAGTPGYMAPESLASTDREDSRADLFSFGCLLFEAAVGRPAFGGEGLDEYIERVLDRGPLPPSAHRPRVPTSFDRLVDMFLSPDPGRRPWSAEEAAVRLRVALDDAVQAREPRPLRHSA